jgi:hypothetical protein
VFVLGLVLGVTVEPDSGLVVVLGLGVTVLEFGLTVELSLVLGLTVVFGLTVELSLVLG